MVDTVTPLSYTEKIKSWAIFLIGLLILFAGPEISEELPNIGFPVEWVPALKSLAKIGAAVLLWLGLSPKKEPVGADK